MIFEVTSFDRDAGRQSWTGDFWAQRRMNFPVAFPLQMSEAAPGGKGLAGFSGSEEDH